MTQVTPTRTTRIPETSGGTSLPWLARLLWLVAAAMLALAVFLIVQRVTAASSSASSDPINTPLELPANSGTATLPPLPESQGQDFITRTANPHTIVASQPREGAITYEVQKGDSIFGIAKKFNLKPESVLWANYDVLNDDPHMIEVGLKLIIPPTDGVYYKWKEGDTLESVAASFKVKPEDILLWPGNKLDITNPVIEPGQYVMVPGGRREFRTWVVPSIPRGPAGVNKSILGPGACDTSQGGAYGSGTFIWPAPQHVLSGNDYWDGHMAIDIAAGIGDPIYAADSGVVVYAGWISGGYGNMVMIDHGNGYQTLYAHLSAIRVSCGASVRQGQVIGLAGSTGRSTGPHLHFEVRYMGGFINPWYVLP
ncbi:peptidoglycan DD-metalloendopeptidase family protein [Thermanaerothrix sp. 4228-RoL]|uniref:Peptidoglycan DD-metalloendopeptidase family protein n=1 Tax=Thermanaerothrix solaris TaxID=3058434 RepID=A0ABU3NR32_9CHLR|nr:peptidoglycan DD-metalloendopeptidase family protein [Thermanaerothrix sp. 4228-RoL]MDT8899288.1 peptidoglycan DD-metalloendopeptidase family protein [Thermanaerothrix sp. 4228-RoL]